MVYIFGASGALVGDESAIGRLASLKSSRHIPVAVWNIFTRTSSSCQKSTRVML
jgi:hypothetical protein